MYLDIANIQIKPGCVTNWLCSDSKKKDVFQVIFLCNNSRKFTKWIGTLSCERATIEKIKRTKIFLRKQNVTHTSSIISEKEELVMVSCHT